MILGMSTATYTVVHVALSLLGIGSGFVVIFGLIRNRPLDGWTPVFLASTAVTSITGFGFPFEHTCCRIVSLLVLAVTIPARYVFHLTGRWRSTYVVGAAIALYLNVFVGVVQAFLKVPALKALAPKQTEPPFLVAQLVVLAIFIVLPVLAIKRFPDKPAAQAMARAA